MWYSTIDADDIPAGSEWVMTGINLAIPSLPHAWMDSSAPVGFAITTL